MLSPSLNHVKRLSGPVLAAVLGVAILAPHTALASDFIYDQPIERIQAIDGNLTAGYEIGVGSAGRHNDGYIWKADGAGTFNNLCFWFAAGDQGGGEVINSYVNIYSRGTGVFPTGGSNTLLETSELLTFTPPTIATSSLPFNTAGEHGFTRKCYEFADPVSYVDTETLVFNIDGGDSTGYSYIMGGGGGGNPSNPPTQMVFSGNIGNTSFWSGSAAPFELWLGPPPVVDACLSGVSTRICYFTPEDGVTIDDGGMDYADVEFTLGVWIGEEDVDGPARVRIDFTNIDQNVLLFGLLSPNTTTFVDEVISESGTFTFATTTPLPSGNYRIRTTVSTTAFYGFFNNPFNDLEESHQFIVGEATFIGNLSQNGWSIVNGHLTSQSATSSLALVAQCSPFADAGFDMANCLAGLFIPDSGQIQNTINGAREGILSRAPWGYFTRFVQIMGSNATSTLPSYTVTFAGNTAEDTHSLSFNPTDMFAGGAAILTDIRDPYNEQNARDIFEPIIKTVVALLVILTIAADIVKSHEHQPEVGMQRKQKNV